MAIKGRPHYKVRLTGGVEHGVTQEIFSLDFIPPTVLMVNTHDELVVTYRYTGEHDGVRTYGIVDTQQCHVLSAAGIAMSARLKLWEMQDGEDDS